MKLALALAASLLAAPALGAETIILAPGTAHEAPAFVDGPEDAAEAVLIVHDYFGVSASMMAEAKYQAEHGRRAIIVDLYGGQVADDDAQASELMSALDRAAAGAKIAAAIEALGEGGRPVRLIGFSMGGGLALEAALAAPGKVRSAVLIYGGGYETIPDAALLAAPPLLIVSGSADEWSYPALVALQDRLIALGNPAETYVLAGEGHGYAQSMFQRGAFFDKGAVEATRLAAESFAARNP